MPQEIVNEMGIRFVSTPEERDRELDDQLLALLMTWLDEEKKLDVIAIFGEDYYRRKVKKAEKALAREKYKGKTVNVSQNPGLTTAALAR